MKAIAFELNTPMSSWATGGASIIPTMSEPTWSAVVGMIGAAAFGIIMLGWREAGGIVKEAWGGGGCCTIM